MIHADNLSHAVLELGAESLQGSKAARSQHQAPTRYKKEVKATGSVQRHGTARASLAAHVQGSLQRPNTTEVQTPPFILDLWLPLHWTGGWAEKEKPNHPWVPSSKSSGQASFHFSRNTSLIQPRLWECELRYQAVIWFWVSIKGSGFTNKQKN